MDVQVSTVEPASGGAFPESIDSIKFNAPLDYASQGRCVTAEDYKTFVKGSFQTLKRFLFLVEKVALSIHHWELFQLKSLKKFLYQLNQPRATLYPQAEKERLVQDLSPFTVASITPVIVDPETIFLY